MIKKILVNRLVIYPIIWSFIWTFLFLKFPNFHLIALTKEGLYALNISYLDVLSMKIQFILFGWVFGYVYGTLSILLKAREFKGLIFIIILFLKVMVSMFVSITFGYLLYPLEIILFPMILLLFKIYKTYKGKKRKEKQALVNQKDKEELLNHIKEIVREQKKDIN